MRDSIRGSLSYNQPIPALANSPGVAVAGVGSHWEKFMNKQEVALLSKEIEMLMNERARLLRVVGAAAVLVANTDAENLPAAAVDAAEMLSETLNALPEETLKDALDSVRAETE